MKFFRPPQSPTARKLMEDSPAARDIAKKEYRNPSIFVSRYRNHLLLLFNNKSIRSRFIRYSDSLQLTQIYYCAKVKCYATQFCMRIFLIQILLPTSSTVYFFKIFKNFLKRFLSIQQCIKKPINALIIA